MASRKNYRCLRANASRSVHFCTALTHPASFSTSSLNPLPLSYAPQTLSPCFPSPVFPPSLSVVHRSRCSPLFCPPPLFALFRLFFLLNEDLCFSGLLLLRLTSSAPLSLLRPDPFTYGTSSPSS